MLRQTGWLNAGDVGRNKRVNSNEPAAPVKTIVQPSRRHRLVNAIGPPFTAQQGGYRLRLRFCRMLVSRRPRKRNSSLPTSVASHHSPLATELTKSRNSKMRTSGVREDAVSPL